MKKYIMGLIMMVCVAAIASSAHALSIGDFFNGVAKQFFVASPVWGQTASLTLTNQATVYRKERFIDTMSNVAEAARGTNFAPVFSDFVYDGDRGYIYTNDHAGVALFQVNGLSQAQEYNRDKVGSSNAWVRYTGDTAGHYSPRALTPQFAGEGVVSVLLREVYTSHSGSLLMFSGTGAEFDSEFELAKSELSSYVAPNYYAGGVGSLEGTLLHPMSVGEKRYALLFPSAGYVGYDFSADQLNAAHLVELTSNAPDKGVVSGNLKKALLGLCKERIIVGTSRTVCDIGSGAETKKLSIAKEGTSYVVYDYTNPMNVVVVDTFTAEDPLQYTGAVSGIESRTVGAVRRGDTIYVYVAGGDFTPPIALYPNLSPTIVNGKYYGQVWKHIIGTNGWQKVIDIPGDGAQIRDNYIIMTGRSFDPAYPTNNDQVAIWFYDMNTSAWAVRETVSVPSDTGAALIWNIPGAAITQSNGNYYVYLLFAGQSGRNDQYSYINAYEFSSGIGGGTGEEPEQPGSDGEIQIPFFTTSSSFFSPNNLLRFFQRVLRLQ